jgi:hypothetical protein
LELRAAEPIWDTNEAEASVVDRLEAQVEALTQKVGRLERRQQRFSDMVRLLLALHDQTAARLTTLDGGSPALEDLDEVTRESPTTPRPRRSRRTAIRRADG